MKKTTLLMILSLLVAALYGCGTGKDNVTTAATDESVTEKKEENAEEKVTEQQENTEEQKEENIEESSNKSQEELHQEIDALKQEKRCF
jgi:Na+-transporting methylmalonyl-CoA/oxaloacetate decarboxylase gamma subunit